MKKLFNYNWQVRDEWFEWCEQIPPHLLKKELGGGAGSILYTLFHIVEVEHSWIRGIQGKEDVVYEYKDYATMEKVNSLSEHLRNENVNFLNEPFDLYKNKQIKVPWETEFYTGDAIIHHIIVHEIHHIGQLSIWARQLGFTPVSAHFVGRV
ncbi:DinB family protein [Alkalihalobacillus sp. NPDC078783]